MRTPLLRIALLLAAAQYAERGAEAACTALITPQVACPTPNPDAEIVTAVDCQPYTLNTPCAKPYKTFMTTGGAVWKEVTAVECTGDKWTAKDGGAPVDLTASENIVCAKFAPDSSKKCGLCDEVTLGTCAADVCTAGGPFTNMNSGGGCQELACAADEMLSLNGHAIKLEKTKKATCNDQIKWAEGAGVPVTEAVCVKSFACPKVAALAPNCKEAALIKDKNDCAPPTTTTTDALECTGNSLFVPSQSGAGWIPGSVTCDKTKGKWILDTTSTEITKAVCASANPSVIGAPTAPVDCTPVAGLATDCNKLARVKQTVGCVAPTLSTLSKLECTAPSPKLYVDDGNGWKESAAKCDTADGTWKLDGATDTTITAAICVKDDPKPAGAATTEVCGQCNNPVPKDCGTHPGCVDGGTETPGMKDVGGKQCKTLKCDNSFITEPTQQGKVDQLICEEVGGQPVWKYDDVITKATCVKKVSCGKIGHLKSSCTGETEFETCAEIDLTQDAKPVCTAPSDKMFFKPKGGVWAAETSDFECELFSGNWLRGGNEVSEGDSVICAESKKPTCGSTCPAFTDADYDCKPDEGCVAGALATDDASSGCTIKTCTSGEFFVDGTGKLLGGDKIICNAQNAWVTNEVAPTAVTSALCVKKFECLKKNPISSYVCDDLETPTGCDAVDLTVNSLVCANSGSPNLYVKPATGPWEQETGPIVCDEKSGVWMRGDPAQPMAKGDAVVCHTALPVGKTCPDLVTMDDGTACQGDTTIEGTAAATCLPIRIDHDNPIDCANELYFQTDRSVMWMKAAKPFLCDKNSNAWKDKSTAIDGVVKKVICVSGEPNHKHTCLPLPTSDCAPVDVVDATLGCSAVAFLPAAVVGKDYAAINALCPNDKKFYFKPKGKNYFQEALSIKCLDDKTWQLTLPHDIVADVITQITGNEDSFICAKSNPHKEVCTRSVKINSQKDNFEFEVKPDKKYEVGQRFECGDTKEEQLLEFVSSGGNTLIYQKNIMCNQDGKWIFNDKDHGQVACGLRNCRRCDKVPDDVKKMSPLQGITSAIMPTEANSDCFDLGCNADKYALQLDGEDMYTNHKGKVQCVKKETTTAGVSKSIWQAVDVDGKNVEISEASCTQKLYCLSASVPATAETAATDPPKLKQVKLDCPKAPSDEVPGCESPTLAGGAHGIAHNTLSCPAGKKILIGPLDKDDQTDFWEDVVGYKVEMKNGIRNEVDTTEVHCDEEYGVWGVRIVEENDKKERRDYRHRIVCGTSNPKKKTTTTTTTTTPAPLVEICALCRDSLPNMPDDFNTTAYLVSDKVNGTGQVCLMKANDGYQLLFGNNQVVDAFMCTREDSSSWFERKCENVKHDENGTVTNVCKQSGTRIAEFKARLADKDKKWKPLVYVVFAVVLIVIGGMGIGFVLIFLRMRKDLSEKEKKKERGVTKKYTAANVMKTSGKSSGGRSELGKSKEPTKSKMEENDDAPTLKL